MMKTVKQSRRRSCVHAGTRTSIRTLCPRPRRPASFCGRRGAGVLQRRRPHKLAFLYTCMPTSKFITVPLGGLHPGGGTISATAMRDAQRLLAGPAAVLAAAGRRSSSSALQQVSSHVWGQHPPVHASVACKIKQQRHRLMRHAQHRPRMLIITARRVAPPVQAAAAASSRQPAVALLPDAAGGLLEQPERACSSSAAAGESRSRSTSMRARGCSCCGLQRQQPAPTAPQGGAASAGQRQQLHPAVARQSLLPAGHLRPAGLHHQPSQPLGATRGFAASAAAPDDEDPFAGPRRPGSGNRGAAGPSQEVMAKDEAVRRVGWQPGRGGGAGLGRFERAVWISTLCGAVHMQADPHHASS